MNDYFRHAPYEIVRPGTEVNKVIEDALSTGLIAISTESFTHRIYLVRYALAQFIARLL